MSSLELAIHHQRIHESLLGMFKRARQAADNFEAETSPQLHSALIRAHNKIKLHRAKSAFFSSLQRMQTHCSRDSTALRGGRSDVAAIRDVRASSLLVRLYE